LLLSGGTDLEGLAVGSNENEQGADAAGIKAATEAAELAEEQAIERIEDWEVADDYAEDFAEDDLAPTGAGESGYAVKGRRGRADHEAHKDRPRVIQFLIAVWAELQRVQWPNRQALVTLTGVVLGFVLIAGGYLGLLDAIFSKLIQAIL
jgi:preprotein translocase SecE subunit